MAPCVMPTILALVTYIKQLADSLKGQYSGDPNNIRVTADNDAITLSSAFRNAANYNEETHPWIKSIQDFSDFLRNSPDRKSIEPVKIAIIDDGIDAMEEHEFSIAGGASFYPNPHSSDFMNPYFVPSGKHGTLMAKMICNLCPDARLYIARLEELPSLTNSGRRITAKSAAKAVEWAIECGVDIISMSWTVEGDSDARDIQDLGEAIPKGNGERILMFCSASDQGGQNPDKCFPGEWEGMCLRIGAATFLGDKLTWVSDKVDFWFPGRDVAFKSSNNGNGNGKTITYESGSSVATAAASGLASVLIYCGRLLGGVGGKEDPFRARETMKEAFTKMSSGADRKFPRVQNTFAKSFGTKLLHENPQGPKKPDIPNLQWDEVSKKALSSLIEDLKNQ